MRNDIRRHGMAGPLFSFAALASLLLLAMAGRAGAEVKFTAAFDVIPTLNPDLVRDNSIREVDIDGDGRLDLIVSGGVSYIGVHRGLAGGGFGPVEPLFTLPNGGVPAYDLGDLNGDGRLDLVVADGHQLAWSLLGNGDGTFQTPRAFLSLFAGNILRLLDLDLDGRLDVVGAAGRLYVCRGLGDGRFQFVMATNPPPSMAWDIAVADFDLDGLPDLLVPDRHGNNVGFFRGRPGVTLSDPVFIAVGTGPSAVRVADLDEDGVPDAMVSNAGGGSVTLLYGVPAGVPGRRQDLTGLPRPSPVVAVDMDADGHRELAIGRADVNVDEIDFFWRNPDGSWTRSLDVAAGFEPGAFVMTDANGDGVRDIVAMNQSYSRLAVVHGHGGLAFGDRRELSSVPQIWDMWTGDVNGDLRPDVIAVSASLDGQIGVHLGQAGGSMAPLSSTGGPGGLFMFNAGFGDMNGDGRPDVATPVDFYNRIEWALGGPGGTFVRGEPTGLSTPPVWLAMADFNEDGRSDVAAATGSGIAVLLSTTSGKPGPATMFGSSQRFVAVADLNRDGHADLVATNSAFYPETGSLVVVLLGHGDGTFSSLPGFYAGSRPTFIAPGDLNGDAIPDLAIVIYGEQSIALYRGVGDGTFAPLSVISTPSEYARRILLADVDADGVTDLVASTPKPVGISIWPGVGGGAFGARLFFGTRSRPDVIRLADFDMNGLPDIVVGHIKESRFEVLENLEVPRPVPALVSTVETAVHGRRVRIVWQSSSPALFGARVQRRNGDEWREVGAVVPAGFERVSFEEDLAPGEYDYRLELELDRSLVPAGEVHVRVGGGLALLACTWSSSPQAFSASVSLEAAAPARFEILDIAGRVVARSELAAGEGGEREVVLAPHARAGSGIFWARLSQGDRFVVRRVVLIR